MNDSNINNNNNNIKFIAIPLNIETFENEIKSNFKDGSGSSDDSWNKFNNSYKRLILFIRKTCESLSLSSMAYFHSILLLKRYLKQFSIDKYNKYLVSISCILICIKVNSASILPMKVRDLLNVSYYILKNERLLINDDYYNFKDNILSMEQIVLQTLSYNISVSNVNNSGKITDELPHPFLFNFLYFLDFENDHVITQISLNLLNDSCLIPFIQSPYFKPEEIAIYSIQLAYQYSTHKEISVDKLILYQLLGLSNSSSGGSDGDDVINGRKFDDFKNNNNNYTLVNNDDNSLVLDFFTQNKKEKEK